MNQNEIPRPPQQLETTVTAAPAPIAEQREPAHAMPSPAVPPVATPAEPEIFEHGRKITVKRRMLKADGSENGEGQDSDKTQLFEAPSQSQPAEGQTPANESSPPPETASGREISFGRR